jgi:hypothetical protein
METPDLPTGIFRLALEGDGVQLQLYHAEEKRWIFVRMTRGQVRGLVSALNQYFPE